MKEVHANYVLLQQQMQQVQDKVLDRLDVVEGRMLKMGGATQTLLTAVATEQNAIFLVSAFLLPLPLDVAADMHLSCGWLMHLCVGVGMPLLAH